ncbi:MAG: pre-peptidase C-terminal domain-containing protein [Acidobacteria bacterium]|nr:pre-peptidase C-terminal domain-containing protein [Acidobacteriota bacterium]MBI3423725.1 pre-peptidase C-terminal domain-containing protein [Acidobacteriota bacterium]
MQIPRRFTRRQVLCYSTLALCASLSVWLITPGWPVVAQSLQAQRRAPVVSGGKSKTRNLVNAPQQTTVPLTPGTPQTGTINGGTTSCVLSPTQYTIATTADTKRLLLSLSGNQDVDLYVRYNSPLVIQGGQLVFDYNSDSAETQEEIAVTPNVLPPLQTGTYYVGVVNCSISAASFTLTGTVSNGGGQITEELATDDSSADDAFVGSGFYYLNRLTPLQYPAQLQKIRLQLAPLQGLPNPTGASIRLLAFNLPTGAALPATLPTSLLLDRMVILPAITTLRFYDFDINELPVIREGDWYIGYQAPNPAAGVGIILDQSSVPQSRFLFSNSSGGPFQLDTEENAMIRAVVVSGSAPNAVASVSAASFSADALAASSIVAAFGAKLATGSASSTAQPLPTTLAGTTVKVRDSAGVERPAALFFVSPGQVNYLVPAGTANGTATVTVTSSDATVSTGTLNIVSVAPGLLAANANGQGIAAGVVLRVKADNSQVIEPLVTFDAAQNRFVAVPIDVSNAAEQVFAILFGTGFRNVGSIANVTVKLGGQDAAVNFAGAQGGLDGLDQLNVRVASSLAGRGELEVAFTAGGRNANVVKINVK